MCLNCLPRFNNCLLFVPLKAATIIISLCGLVVATILIVLLITSSHKLGLKTAIDKSGIGFVVWFIFNICLTILANLLAVLVWTKAVPVKHEDSRDIMLQVFFWLFVASFVSHLSLSIAVLAVCWQACLAAALAHLGVFLLYVAVALYLMVVVNSYRMTLWTI